MNWSEITFIVFAFGFLLDELTAALEHGWDGMCAMASWCASDQLVKSSVYPKHVEWIRPCICGNLSWVLGMQVSWARQTRLLVERSCRM